MKRSLRRPFAVLLFVVLCGAASFPSALRRAVAPAPVLAPLLDPARLNATLLRLAAVDPSEASLRRDVDDLLEGRLPASSARSRGWRRDRLHPLHLRHHQFPIHRRGHQDHDHDPLLHPLPHQELLLDSSLRRALLSWHRLRRHDPTVLRNLPSLLSLPGRIPSCAVVGNSGILLRASHGSFIDSHAAVFRLNNARISGFAAHVGAKTNLSFINSNILHLCARRPGCFCHPYGDGVPILLYICQAVHFLDVAACNASSPSRHAAPISVTDPRLDVLCARIVKYYSLRRFVTETSRAADEWSSAHDAAMFHYSSGMQAIMVAVGVCDKVSVFGFGKAADAKHHYHSNQKTELDLHDYEAEYAFYRDLAERPQMEARKLRKVISKLREMIENKAEDLKKVVGGNFSQSDAPCCNDMNRTLLEVEAIAESLIQMSLETAQYEDVPDESEAVQGEEVNDDDSDLYPTEYGDDLELVGSVVDSPDEEYRDELEHDVWSFESDRSWHLHYV